MNQKSQRINGISFRNTSVNNKYLMDILRKKNSKTDLKTELFFFSSKILRIKKAEIEKYDEI